MSFIGGALLRHDGERLTMALSSFCAPTERVVAATRRSVPAPS
jgi:hypothetical protein